MTPMLGDDIRSIFNKIWNNKLNFIKDEKIKTETKRISEEIAINLAVQSNFPNTIISSLKKDGHPKNIEIIQSTYYGCANRIIE